MPTYIYYCECGHVTEELRAVKNRDVDTYCPDCNSILKRKIENSSKPIFKCAGFYDTDYKAKSQPQT